MIDLSQLRKSSLLCIDPDGWIMWSKDGRLFLVFFEDDEKTVAASIQEISWTTSR